MIYPVGVMAEKEAPRMTAERLEKEFGITVTAEFVPWSKSRSFDPKIGKDVSKKNLNWKVTMYKDGKAVVTTDYSAGIAHAPYYKKATGHKWSLYNAASFEHEIEKGTEAVELPNLGAVMGNSKKPILPDSADVVYALVNDSDVLQYGNFEEWADSIGFNPDSRKDEQIYQACLGIALKMNHALGSETLEKLREAYQDF